jgi:hypothetical protein
MKKNIQHTVFAIIILILPVALWAQDNTSSVYSKFGIGDLANVGYGRNLALGGTGFGIRDASFLNPKNPASLTAIDSLSFLFETGVHGRTTWSVTSDRTQVYWDGNITHVSWGHRYNRWLMGSAGIMPYSNIGYNIITSGSANVENSVKESVWTGSGGVNKAFYSMGYKLDKNISLGIEGSFLFGPQKLDRKTYFLVANEMEATDQYTEYIVQNRYYGFGTKVGAQYTAKLGTKGTVLTVGGVYSPQSSLQGKSNVTAVQFYSGVSTPDTIDYETDKPADKVKLPAMYGGGFSLILKGKYLFAADYETNQWSINTESEYKNQNIYSVGFEILPQNSLQYFGRCGYRIGFRYDDGYINVKRNDIKDMRLSLGVGFPIQKSRSTLNVTAEVGRKGTLNRGLVREDYTKLTVAFSFHDYWFIKRKFD